MAAVGLVRLCALPALRSIDGPNGALKPSDEGVVVLVAAGEAGAVTEVLGGFHLLATLEVAGLLVGSIRAPTGGGFAAACMFRSFHSGVFSLAAGDGASLPPAFTVACALELLTAAGAAVAGAVAVIVAVTGSFDGGLGLHPGLVLLEAAAVVSFAVVVGATDEVGLVLADAVGDAVLDSSPDGLVLAMFAGLPGGAGTFGATLAGFCAAGGT